MSSIDIIQIIIGILTLIATITVSVVIYLLQMKHEKEQKQRELEEKAKRFLIDNEAERDYLPWCVIAANLHRLEKHTRDIYTAYCRCSSELQNEILKQSGFNIGPIEGTGWVKECFSYLKKDIETYNLGRNYLYEDAKYFFRGYKQYRELHLENTIQKFDPICKQNNFREIFNMNKINIADYIDEYFYYYIDKNMEFDGNDPQPPMDMVWDFEGLSNAKENIVCMWIMELVQHIAIQLGNRERESVYIKNEELNYTDAVSETYEDKYYEALQALYNTYHKKTAKKDK